MMMMMMLKALVPHLLGGKTGRGKTTLLMKMKRRDDLESTSRDFQQAYWLFMGVVKDLQEHYGHGKSTKDDEK
jgi:hypothetical protein